MASSPDPATAVDPRAAPLARLLRLNARLVENCFDEVTDEQAVSRPLPSTNSMAFVLAHLIDARHTLLAVLGGSLDNPLSSYLAGARGIDDVRTLPPVAELMSVWLAVDDALAGRLGVLTASEFEAAAAQSVPGGDSTVLGTLAFLVQHDSYHLGQLALLRRAHGFPAMRYGRPGAAGP